MDAIDDAVASLSRRSATISQMATAALENVDDEEIPTAEAQALEERMAVTPSGELN
jgi:ssDNA-binding replication factor A large subunit